MQNYYFKTEHGVVTTITEANTLINHVDDYGRTRILPTIKSHLIYRLACVWANLTILLQPAVELATAYKRYSLF